jgi:hypothetical protein
MGLPIRPRETTLGRTPLGHSVPRQAAPLERLNRWEEGPIIICEQRRQWRIPRQCETGKAGVADRSQKVDSPDEEMTVRTSDRQWEKP